jgi:hypothetical protein
MITASELRSDVYRILDRIIDTGEPVEIERKGHHLRIVSDRPTSRLDRLVQRQLVVHDDDDSLIHVDWSTEWTAGTDL